VLTFDVVRRPLSDSWHVTAPYKLYLCFIINRPSAGITSAISKFSAAAQLGAAPGAGSGALSISEAERRRILEEEQRQLDILKVFSRLS